MWALYFPTTFFFLFQSPYNSQTLTTFHNKGDSKSAFQKKTHPFLHPPTPGLVVREQRFNGAGDGTLRQ
jgi:hypothetical protein